MQRDIVTRTQTRIGRLGIVAATENLVKATDWCFQEDDHKIVVHLGGRLDRMECEFSAGPSGGTLPSRGDIWIIPAGCRYAALAQGEKAQFVEFTVPTALLADAPLIARVGFRDDLLFAAAARLSELVDCARDDVATMAAHAISNAVEAHLLDRFGRRTARAAPRALSAFDRTVLVDAIQCQIDAHHSLATLAALVGMDVRRFTAAFREAFGLTPWQYVLRARLERGGRLLRETDRPVTEIAYAVGFSTPSHFATAFARHFGVPPQRYRAGAR
ncbi:MAG TPA: AraC family transcriptional regulator [Sphingomonas sp.]